MPQHYEHDCDACVALGDFTIVEDKLVNDTVMQVAVTYDLYYCPGEPTVVARRSSEGPDYSSGLTFAVRNPEGPLGVAYHRALAAGLCEEYVEPDPFYFDPTFAMSDEDFDIWLGR